MNASTGDVQIVDVPSRVGSAQPHLQSVDDVLWMSWLETVDSTKIEFRVSRFDGTSWSPPQTVTSDPDLLTNRMDIPKIYPLPGGRLAAHFMVNDPRHPLAYTLHLAQTSTSGTSMPDVRAHRDAEPSQHGFASAAAADDRLAAVWLDGRETRLAPGEFDESEWGNMTLRGTTLDRSGTIGESVLLDERVCDCCPTAAVSVGDGVLVAYRDRSDDEVRDIKLVRFDGGAWGAPYGIYDDGWAINGCPVNGPALDAEGKDVALAWFTAAQQEPKVRLAFSRDGGRSFAEPVLVDGGRPRGRVDVNLLDGRSALLSWIGIENRMWAVKLARISAAKGLVAERTVAVPKSTAFTGIPQLAVTDRYAYLAWVDGGHPDSTQIQLVRLDVGLLE